MANQVRVLNLFDHIDSPDSKSVDPSYPEAVDDGLILPERAPLMDLSVDEVERDPLLDSPYNARIQIRLRASSAALPPQFLGFLGRHTDGRGPFPSITHEGVLQLVFAMSDDSSSSLGTVDVFARDVVRILDLTEEEIVSSTIVKMDNNRIAQVLAAAGIESAGLRLV